MDTNTTSWAAPNLNTQFRSMSVVAFATLDISLKLLIGPRGWRLLRVHTDRIGRQQGAGRDTERFGHFVSSNSYGRKLVHGSISSENLILRVRVLASVQTPRRLSG
jgi:hypothetical protein